MIKFGTDGWRAVIAKEFTFEALNLVAHAVSEVLQEKLPEKKKMIVGYDRRFLSKQFAESVASVYAQAGYEVLLGKDYYPTPAISYCAKNENNAAGATMITASHNPPEYNGFKFKEIFGGSALPQTTKNFEDKIAEIEKKGGIPSAPKDFQTYLKSGQIRYFDPGEKYFAAIHEIIDFDRIRKADINIGLDVMHGAAADYLPRLLDDAGVKVGLLHGEANPGFRGVAPEPIGKNLTDLSDLVKKVGLACGLATDGDADRLGAIDEDGNPFTTQQILSLVYWHMTKNRQKNWSIARSVSTTRMVDLIAQRNKKDHFETPVGFKYIAELMIDGKAEIGGEESGGVGIMDHIPERDGLLTALLLLEIIATEGKGLKAVYEDLCRQERPYYFTRVDLHIAQEKMRSALDRLGNASPDSWSGRKVSEKVTTDGHKYYLEDGAWILIRPSGTEPIFRLYAEAESESASQELVAAARAFIE